MIPQKAHLQLELKACYIKMDKIGSVCLTIDAPHKQWAFDTLKATQVEIRQLKIKLGYLATPFTALKYTTLKRF
jgi:hypothetical protein